MIGPWILPNHYSSSTGYKYDRFTVTHVHRSFYRAEDYSRIPTLLDCNRPVKWAEMIHIV